VSDAAGNTYVTGTVWSNGLSSTPGVFQPVYAGGGGCTTGPGPASPTNTGACPDAFVAKFNSSGTLVFLTYLGGTGADTAISIAVDPSGEIYVGGTTNSVDFPLAGTPFRSPSAYLATFIAELSSDGKALIWSTVLGGYYGQLALAPDGSLYVLDDYVTIAAFAGMTVTPSLTKLAGNGQLISSVNVPPGLTAVAVGTDGSVYIGGSTNGFGITPTPGAWQTSFTGSQEDGFVAKMNSGLAGFTWLTFVGGGGRDQLGTLLPAPDGSLWITGTTDAPNFPVSAGALQTQSPPGESAYLAHLSSDGSKALASTFVPTLLSSLALDTSGNPIFTASYGGVLQATPGAQWPCQQSGAVGDFGFIGKIDSAAQHLLWGTSTGPSVPLGPVTVAQNGDAIVTGNVTSNDVTLSALTMTPGSPRLVETCIAQAGYPYVSGPLVAGEVVSIYGAGFGPAQGVVAQPSGNTIGTELGGVQVTIEGTPVPLLYASSAQINLVAPYLLNGRLAAHIRIVTANATSNEIVSGVREAAPEIFMNSAGEAIVNQDGTINSEANPAHIGDTVSMWVSGVGQTNFAGMDGTIPTTAGGTPVLPIMVQVQTMPPFANANVTYAGNAPGLVSGVGQVSFQVPSVQPVGSGPPYKATIVLYAGGTSSASPTISGPVIWFE
jgi:uncharacterized protein (TIGR03437 family)